MSLTRTTMREFSNRELIRQLLTNTTEAHKIRQMITERMAMYGVSHPCDLPTEPEASRYQPQSRLLDLNLDNFPWMTRETVLDWMREAHPYQWGLEILQDGYTCQNMTDSEQAMDWINLAILQKTEWRGLTPAAARFWKAVYSKWSIWKMKGRQP